MSKPVLTRNRSNREGEDLAVPLTADLKTAKITLYGFKESPPCYKVAALLHYYGISFNFVKLMPGSKADGIDSAYKKVPKLMINDTQVNDSAIIFKTLTPMLHGTPLTAAQVR